MNTFSIITSALSASENDPAKAGLDRQTIETGRIITAVQTVVDALTPPDGGRYIVGFADISTAGTSLGERRITVSSKPLADARLSMVEKAVVIATFAAHEIGHTLVTKPRKGIAREHNSHSGYHAVANLADDIILEPFMADRYPILQDAFEFTGLWVLRTTSTELPKVHLMTRSMSTPDRFNVLLSASRYTDAADIVFVGDAAEEEKRWGRDWAARLIALRLTDHGGFIALCDEAWERIRTEPDVDDDEQDEDDEPEPEPEQPKGDEPGGESEGADDDEQDEAEDDESEDEDGESKEDGESDEADDDESEPGDEQGEDEGEGGSEEADDDEQDPDEGKDKGGDEPGGDEPTDEPPTTERGEGKGKQPGEQPDNVDWDDDERKESDKDTEASDDGHADDGDPTSDKRGGGGNAEATVRSEDDFDQNKVDETTHDSAEEEAGHWDREQVEQAIRTYASTEVTSFGRHGHMSTDWS
jgi:hypothetical protein